MARFEKIGRRTWLKRTAGGGLAVWAGLELGMGRQGWGVLLGSARPVGAQDELRTVRINFDFPRAPDMPADAPTMNVNAYLLIRGDEIAIVDTMVAGNGARIGNAIVAAGLTWDNVSHLILTHYHPDHVGSAAEVIEQATAATIWSGHLDIPKITLAREIQG